MSQEAKTALDTLHDMDETLERATACIEAMAWSTRPLHDQECMAPGGPTAPISDFAGVIHTLQCDIAHIRTVWGQACKVPRAPEVGR